MAPEAFGLLEAAALAACAVDDHRGCIYSGTLHLAKAFALLARGSCCKHMFSAINDQLIVGIQEGGEHAVQGPYV